MCIRDRATAAKLPVGAAIIAPIQETTFQHTLSSTTSGHAGGSDFRSDGSVSVQPTSVTSQQHSPQANSNILLKPKPSRYSVPAPPADITQTPVFQPDGNIKIETIGKMRRNTIYISSTIEIIPTTFTPTYFNVFIICFRIIS